MAGTSAAQAKKRNQSPRPEVCQQLLLQQRPDLNLSQKGAWAYQAFRSLRQGLPPTVGEFLKSRQSQNVGDSATDIMNIRRRIGQDLLRMAERLDDEPVIKQIILSGSTSVMPTRKEWKSVEVFRQSLGHKRSQHVSKKKKQKLINRMVNFYNPLRSKLDEVAVAFEVPDLVSVNPLVRHSLAKEHHETVIEFNGRDLALKELDVIFEQGRAWGEVKSSITGWTWPGAIRGLTNQAKKMMKAASVAAEINQHPIDIHYFFIGMKPPKEVQCLFEEWGIIMHWAPHVNQFIYPSYLKPPANCEDKAA